MVDRLLGHDSPLDLLYAAGFFAAYWVVDIISRLVSAVDEQHVEGASLLVGAVRSNAVLWFPPIVGSVALAVRSPSRLVAGWGALDHGSVLRWLAAGPVLLLAWQGSLYEYNFLADEAHLIDRLLVVALAVGAFLRPALLMPFVIQSRIVASQFDLPFGTTAAQNIDELLVIVLVALAGAHVVHVVTGAETPLRSYWSSPPPSPPTSSFPGGASC